MIRYIIAALVAATPALAGGIQCPDGRWMSDIEHCKYPPSVQCPGGEYRQKYEHCPASERRPEPKPDRQV